MKRFQVVFVSALLFSVSLLSQAHSSVITGRLLFDQEKPVIEAVVTFFDSVNAELVWKTTTYKGLFQTELKPGYYKIHFSFKSGDVCFNEFFNANGNGENSFDLGTTVKIVEDQSVDLGNIIVFYGDRSSCLPTVCGDPLTGIVVVLVNDSSTGLGVPGIRVEFKDPETAFPLFEESPYEYFKFTDANGMYVLSVKEECTNILAAKIRFSDFQNGIYSPEYYGTTDLDDFSSGEIVKFANVKVQAIDSIAKIPPSEQIGGIIEDVIGVLPPQDAQPVVSSLQQGQALLQDANPNNDQGACGTLTGSANKINGLVSSGKLSKSDADALAASINALKTDLGCKK